MKSINNRLVKKTADKLGQMIFCLIIATTLMVLCIPTSILLSFYTSWLLQIILFIALASLTYKTSNTTFVGLLGAFYLAPIASYIYFYVTNGPLLIFLSLGITSLVFALNYIVISNIVNDNTRQLKFEQLMAGYGKSAISSCFIIIIAIFIMHFIIPLTPVVQLIYSSAAIWYSTLLLILRTGHLLKNETNDNLTDNELEQLSLNYATGMFFDLLNLLIRFLILFLYADKGPELAMKMPLELILLIIASPFIIIYSIWLFATYDNNQYHQVNCEGQHPAHNHSVQPLAHNHYGQPPAYNL